MKEYKNIKEKILEHLKKNPEGVTIQKLSNDLKVSRLTATKYVHELLGEGRIHERKVGVARLLFNRDNYAKAVKDKEIINKLMKKLE